MSAKAGIVMVLTFIALYCWYYLLIFEKDPRLFEMDVENPGALIFVKPFGRFDRSGRFGKDTTTIFKPRLEGRNVRKNTGVTLNQTVEEKLD